MTAYALLFTMAAIGISETVYLIRTRKEADAQVVCPIGGGCHTVLESKYNKTFGVHNDVLGLLFYVVTAVLFALVVIGEGPVAAFAGVASLMIFGAFVMSAYFTLLQAFVIKHWCFWCLMSAATVTIMLMTILAKFPQTIENITSLV